MLYSRDRADPAPFKNGLLKITIVQAFFTGFSYFDGVWRNGDKPQHDESKEEKS
jgi:hypothetical protein